jgi:queuosine precursor transporter
MGSLTPIVFSKKRFTMSATAQADALSPRSFVPLLVGIHIALIMASNYLVQLPFEVFGVHTTWGAFTFPLIFVATDLTVRLLGAHTARRVIARVMVPALLASYGVSVVFQQGAYMGVSALLEFNTFVFRIATASFVAYVLGQWLDIAVFGRLQQTASWWVAPAASTILGSLLDTAVFFSVAFWRSPDAFMAEHWVEIAVVDYFTKLVISLVCFLPLYKALLSGLVKRMQPAPVH